MTDKEKIMFLRRYQELDRQIERGCEEISRWRSRATRLGSVSENTVLGSKGEDSLQTAVEHICEIEQRVSKDIDRLVLLRKKVKGLIATVSEPRLREVLERRYINGETWEKIAAGMNYSYMHVCRLHGLALKALKM